MMPFQDVVCMKGAQSGSKSVTLTMDELTTCVMPCYPLVRPVRVNIYFLWYCVWLNIVCIYFLLYSCTQCFTVVVLHMLYSVWVNIVHIYFLWYSVW